MTKWKVWNMHPHGLTHIERFREDIIEIKAGSYILMDYEDAVQFKGQYYPMKKLADNTPDPATFKVLKIEPAEAIAEEKESPKYVCQLDGKEFATKKELDDHLEKFKDLLITDAEADAEIAAQTKRRTRPPKEQTV